MRAFKFMEFDAGHRVPDHKDHTGAPGQCASPHGHRYRVEMVIDGEVQSDGMTLDFGIMKRLFNTYVHDVLDHAMILDIGDPLRTAIEACGEAIHPGKGFKVVGMIGAPTAENIAAWIAGQLADEMAANGVTLLEVTVWETPTAGATWEAGRD